MTELFLELLKSLEDAPDLEYPELPDNPFDADLDSDFDPITGEVN